MRPSRRAPAGRAGKASMQPYIDLHAHSTASDGSLSPRELVAAAKQLELAAIAITDHDTIDGLEEAMEAGMEFGIEVVPAVELSVDAIAPDGRAASLHLLGYFVDSQSAALNDELKARQHDRDTRNHKILEKLNQHGIGLTMEQVQAFQPRHGSLGRPHFAHALVKHGIVESYDQAFSQYLARGAKAYVHKRRLSQEQGIKLITQAGGVPALAHPAHLLGSYKFFINLLQELKGYGLKAMETYYGEYSQQQMGRLLNLARKFGFAACGGSDFHGQSKPWLQLGSGRGELKVPYSCLEEIKQKLGGARFQA